MPKSGSKTKVKRDYAAEYKKMYGGVGPASTKSPLHQRRRKEKARRQQARRLMKKRGYDVSGKDVDHIDGNPLNNKPANLRVVSIRKNRGLSARKERGRENSNGHTVK